MAKARKERENSVSSKQLLLTAGSVDRERQSTDTLARSAVQGERSPRSDSSVWYLIVGSSRCEQILKKLSSCFSKHHHSSLFTYLP